jgi:hypothetical protein
MTRTAVWSGLRRLVPATGLGILLLAGPSPALAADEPVTAPAISAVATDPGTGPDAGMDTGPVLLLLVAGTLGLLGVLSGPATAVPDRDPVAHRRPIAH